MVRRLVYLACLLLCACSVTSVKPVPVVAPGETLHLYLQPLPKEAASLSIKISKLDAIRSDGEAFPLLEEPLSLVAESLVGQQIRLLKQRLPLGEYQGLRLQIEEATQAGEDGPVALLTSEEPLLLSNKFRIGKNEATALFISLTPDRLVTDGYRLTASFSLWSPQPPLTELKGLVSHPATGALTLFEKKTPLAYSVMALGQQPGGIALDQSSSRAYVALSQEDAIVAIDLRRQQIERKLRLRSGDRPQRLALAGNNRYLLVSHRGSSAVSIIDTRLFRELTRLQFISRPADTIASANGMRAYVLLPETNSLGLIDIERGSIDSRVDLPETPILGSLSRDGELLFLLTETSPDLLLLDSSSLQLLSQAFVGYGATCLTTADSGLVYVGLQSGEVLVVDPRVTLAIDQFRVGGPVQDLVLDRQENSLFVLTGKTLEKYDLVSKRKTATLDLGMTGVDVAVMGEP